MSAVRLSVCMYEAQLSFRRLQKCHAKNYDLTFFFLKRFYRYAKNYKIFLALPLAGCIVMEIDYTVVLFRFFLL